MSRSLSDLNPQTQKRAELFLQKCRAAGIDVLITCTLRTHAEQNDLYAQGRNKPGKKVTNAKAGYSWHNFGCAFDFVPIMDKKPQWNDMGLFEKCGAIGESVGLEWGGRWSKFPDFPHLQYTGGLTLAQARAGKTIA